MEKKLLSALFIALLILRPGRSRAEPTALDRYVAAPDPSYEFHVVSSLDKGDHKEHIIEMTSQTFLSEKEVDKPVWKHWMTIVVPDHVTSSTALLYINGGSSDLPAPKSAEREMVFGAMATHSVVADLFDVPSEPLVFAGDGRKRTEDGIIAFTWDKFLTTGEERWPLRLPMTKAAVRAMDTVQTFCQSDAGGKVKIDAFAVAGASKRGWTTWSTAAVDRRVVAIIPLVIDTLHMEQDPGRQVAAYGSFSPAIRDYTDINLSKWMGTPQFHDLMKIEDPWSYRDRYTMPKLLINSTGDQYFLPDNSQFYFDDLPAPKYLRYVPNTDHSLAHADAHETLLAFYGAFLRQKPMPRFSWKLQDDASIRVETIDHPVGVKLWQATNPTARDFRLAVLGPRWVGTELTDQGDGTYIATVPKPGAGWTAFMAELTFTNGQLPPLKFTTPVRVVPDTLPFADKVRDLEKKPRR
jgi:PhoPQ-activated pathogenicity-related protein